MIEIKPIKSHQVEEVKRVIIAVCNEIWQLPEEVIRHYDAMSDIDDVQSHYFDNKGTFLVLIDEERVVGSGAIRRLSDDICELKRMWFLKDYRGRGLGTKMAQMLLDFARIIGYKKVRLDTIDEQKQAQALKLYQRLGFYFIERYNTSPCTVFMEKML
ncbi:GNAT family N-acetyltransferase [Trichocoleus sp. DQ-A3]|uniref:GNAT family N-acetyltransferase n=1 Tax=Cyanophyceae TaxID=3028117 RepID=UPI0016880EDA|nr:MULTISPECIES: GNAT family N-acetyltransferase [unclassified Coleofasciculus]MBD1894867.1 GNAT family N-acetyltransferase [Coleofasciculus sp. FACHB-129]MBD1899957.1 GNAT family N-acetyltransferase [Coleofasciculus sp. FACHB-125]